MLEKLKGIGSQMASTASGAVEGLSATVRDGVETITSAAANVTEAVNEKVVRASTAQACNILEVAIQELSTRPLSNQPVTLTTTVNFGVASLELQVNLPARTAEPANTRIAADAPAPD